MESLRKKNKQEIDELEAENNELSEQLNTANYMKEKLQRENTTLQSEYKKFSTSLRDDFGGGAGSEKLAEQERRIADLEEKL